MLPGPVKIYQCPNCKSEIGVDTIRSGNTFGAILYSDGKTDAPMLPEEVKITKCSNCDNIFWLESKNIVKTVEPWDKDKLYPEAQKAEVLSLYDYILALEQNVFNSIKDEEYLRIRLMWKFNDRIRDYWYFYENNYEFWCKLYHKGEEKGLDNDKVSVNHKILLRDKREKKIWKENILRIIELLADGDDGKIIMIAELYRNLGEFEKSKTTLMNIENNELNWILKAIEEECDKNNTFVFKLSEG